MSRTPLIALLLALPLLALAGEGGNNAPGNNAPGNNAPGNNAQVVVNRLKLGNERFAADVPSRVDVSATGRALLAAGQHPFCTVLGCSDSRVTPEHLFEAGLGDIFDVRVAGNVVDGSSLASVEYAVEKLHTPVVVVLGHEDCGAVKAFVAGEPTWPSMDALLKQMGPAVTDKSRKPPVEEAAKANVAFQIGKLVRSEIISKALTDRTLVVKGAYYDVDSGKVEWLDEPKQDNATPGPNGANGRGGDGSGVQRPYPN